MKRSLAGLCLLLVLPAAACNLWNDDLGSIALPYRDASTRSLAQYPLDERTATTPRSIDDGLRAIREREPSKAGEAPRAVRTDGTELVPMSIAEVRLLVLRNNLDLQASLLDPAIARAKVGAEIGRFDALIGSRFAYRRTDTPRIDGPLVDISSDDPGLDGSRAKLTEVEQRKDRLDMGLGLRLPLPTGGEVAFEGSLDQKIVTDPKRFEQYLAATRFSLSQPLLRNAGPDANLASIRLARTDARISQVRTKLVALRILAGAEKAYWGVYASRRLLDVRAEQFRLASENLELVRRRVAEGLSPRVEIARAEVGVYQRTEALIIAETAWRLRQRDLKVRLASDRFPLRGGRMLEIVTQPRLAGLDLDVDTLIARALQERLDLIELELGLVRDGIEIGLRENEALPIVNLDFHYGFLARDDSLGRAWESQWDFEHPELSVGLRFEVPLTNQRRQARLEEAILSRARRLATREARELMVREEVLDMTDVIGRNWQRIVAARQNVIVAGVNYDAEQRQFAQGLRTSREVLEALADLGDAQVREIQAIVEYQVAQVDLAFATGTLLGYSRIELEPLQLPDRR